MAGPTSTADTWACGSCHLLESVSAPRWLSGKEPATRAGDVRNVGSIPGLGRSPGAGHGNPLQYSCLRNPMDGGAWWTTVPGVVKSQIQLGLHDGAGRSQKGKREQPGRPPPTIRGTQLGSLGCVGALLMLGQMPSAPAPDRASRDCSLPPRVLAQPTLWDSARAPVPHRVLVKAGNGAQKSSPAAPQQGLRVRSRPGGSAPIAPRLRSREGGGDGWKWGLPGGC